MKIATFNANSIRSRLHIVRPWLTANEPDVLCIQETKTPDSDFPVDEFAGLGYYVTFSGQKGYNGVAIASRKKPDKVSFGLDNGSSPDHSRLLYARFGPVHVVNTYVPQGREITSSMYEYKLQWFERLRSFFERNFSARQKLLWTGDINIAPDRIDVHNPDKQKKHVCFHEDARKAFRDTVAWGFTDVFRLYHPEPGQYSFYDYRTKNAVERKIGWRVDHVLATRSLAKHSKDCYIDVEPRKWNKPSDHTFVVAEFTIPGASQKS